MYDITFYLAHPIRCRHEVRKIELKLERELGINLLNPFYDTSYRPEVVAIDNKTLSIVSPSLDERSIVQGDLKNLFSTKGVVSIIPRDVTTIGTIWEMSEAYRKSMPIFLYSTIKKFIMNPWIKYHCKVSTTLEDLKENVNEWIKTNYC